MAPWSPIRRDRETPAPESCRADAYRRLVFIEGAAHRQGPVRGRTLAGRGSLLDGSFRFLAQVHPPSRHRTRTEGGNADDLGPFSPLRLGLSPWTVRLELGLPFPLLLDARTQVSYGLYRVIGILTSVFVDKQGTIREIIIGAIPLEELNEKVESLLEAAA